MLFGLNVIYKMKPGMREEFLTAVVDGGILDAVRAEEGCVEYSYFRSVEDENCLLLVERWTDRDAQKRHMSHPNMNRLTEIRNRCALGTTLTTYDA